MYEHTWISNLRYERLPGKVWKILNVILLTVKLSLDCKIMGLDEYKKAVVFLTSPKPTIEKWEFLYSGIFDYEARALKLGWSFYNSFKHKILIIYFNCKIFKPKSKCVFFHIGLT